MTNIEKAIENAWSKIAPFWPLDNLIACNPIKGFENLPIEQALEESTSFFQYQDLPSDMLEINKQSIKWFKLIFDQGQATIEMPFLSEGIYNSWRKLAVLDKELGITIEEVLLQDPLQTITQIINELNINGQHTELFLTLMLTTLPGWAAHIKYLAEWADTKNATALVEFLAIRIAITYALWPNAAALIDWHMDTKPKTRVKAKAVLEHIISCENLYKDILLKRLQKAKPQTNPSAPLAQFLFCIDIRSEPFRRVLEKTGRYETFGVAGFFGIPIKIQDTEDDKTYASCPVLLQPKHTVVQHSKCGEASCLENHGIFHKMYQSLKYNFLTAFALADTIGSISAVWTLIRTIFPSMAAQLDAPRSHQTFLDINDIPLANRCEYALNLLKSVGLTSNFSKFIVICGHESSTKNSTYATLFDCGACGGHSGYNNAKIAADILNDVHIREYLKTMGIDIPNATLFISGVHNTTTDKVHLDTDTQDSDLNIIQQDLAQTGMLNSSWRSERLYHKVFKNNDAPARRTAMDWAEIRPEYGLACNASFIIGPRWLTSQVDLDGRSFLHSYDWQQDLDGLVLASILAGPVVVGQWINSQYLFSALDNAAYGSGSKVTHNVIGKIGVMQGVESDLMHGLPFQSVYYSDIETLHEPIRLQIVIHAPTNIVEKAINTSPQVLQLFKNEWIHVHCLDPVSMQCTDMKLEQS